MRHTVVIVIVSIFFSQRVDVWKIRVTNNLRVTFVFHHNHIHMLEWFVRMLFLRVLSVTVRVLSVTGSRSVSR